MKKLILTAAVLMAAVCLPAQNKWGGINLSLWKNVSTQPLDSTQSSYFNLGVLTNMYRLNGLGINILGGTTQKNVSGVQLSGISNMAGGSMYGVQLSGISNISGDNMTGISAAGLVAITGDNVKGAVFSGMTSISGDNTTGLMASGIMNITGDVAAGVQLSGLTNITGSSFKGVMASGLLNITGDAMNGLQLSGLSNIAGEQLNGVQIGLTNIAVKANGLQIGLVNYYKDEMKGFQLGLVNANPNTKVQMMLFGGNATKVNVGARFKNELFYTILGGGTHYLDFSDEFSASFFYRAGLELPLCKRLSISGDLGYQHIETFKNKDYGIPARLYALQARINLEYRLAKKFGIFATGGYGGSRYYNKAQTYDKGVIVEAGVVLF